MQLLVLFYNTCDKHFNFIKKNGEENFLKEGDVSGFELFRLQLHRHPLFILYSITNKTTNSLVLWPLSSDFACVVVIFQREIFLSGFEAAADVMKTGTKLRELFSIIIRQNLIDTSQTQASFANSRALIV